MRKWNSGKEDSDGDKDFDGVSDDEPLDKDGIPEGCEWVPVELKQRPASAVSSTELQKTEKCIQNTNVCVPCS